MGRFPHAIAFYAKNASREHAVGMARLFSPELSDEDAKAFVDLCVQYDGNIWEIPG